MANGRKKAITIEAKLTEQSTDQRGLKRAKMNKNLVAREREGATATNGQSMTECGLDSKRQSMRAMARSERRSTSNTRGVS